MISKTQQEFLFGALIGGAIGAATTLMLTPFSGASLRRQVSNGFSHLNGASSSHKATRKPAAVSKARSRTAGHSASTHAAAQHAPAHKTATHAPKLKKISPKKKPSKAAE